MYGFHGQYLRVDLERCGPDNALAVYDDANVRLADLRILYISGGIELAQRALGESLYYAVCRKVQEQLAADPRESPTRRCSPGPGVES